MLTKRNPRPQTPMVEIKVAIPVELDAMLNQAVISSGIAKAAIVRDALAQYGENLGYLAPGTSDHIIATRTRGPGVATQRKDS